MVEAFSTYSVGDAVFIVGTRASDDAMVIKYFSEKGLSWSDPPLGQPTIYESVKNSAGIAVPRNLGNPSC